MSSIDVILDSNFHPKNIYDQTSKTSQITVGAFVQRSFCCTSRSTSFKKLADAPGIDFPAAGASLAEAKGAVKLSVVESLKPWDQ